VKKPSPISVKRYGVDRLYDTVGGRYVTIANLREWSSRAISFVVIDARSGEDITRLLAG
jgi:polyhydroxyalkanoate synthesis regulator protein